MSAEEAASMIEKKAALQFDNIEHEVVVCMNDDILTIQVENCETLEQWIGKYDVSYIEELSHKTGNFKQFLIFCNMLESALSKNTKSVTLDLLTYEDLKILREKKLGAASNIRKKLSKQAMDAKLQTKRYLIMTYTVEFDKIHYPLPLTFTGIKDVPALKQQVKELERENAQLRSARKHQPNSKMQVEYEKLLEENQGLKEELETCYDQLKEIGTGNLSKELKILKKVVQNLETDLVKERSKHQRAMMKKKKVYDDLLQEFEDLKASERNYRVRCKNLTDELAMMKRNSRLSPAVSGGKPKRMNRSSSRDRTQHERSAARGRSISTERRKATSRSVSRDRNRTSSVSSIERRTPSPERNDKRKENEANRSRHRTPKYSSIRTVTPKSINHLRKPPISGSTNHKKWTSGSSSIERRYSNNSEDSVTRLKTRNSSKKHRSTRQRTQSSDEYDAPQSRVMSIKKSKHHKRYKDGTDDDDEDKHSIGIAEIDARLEALKNFMKDTME